MVGKDAAIPTANGIMDAYVARPDSGGPFALVIVFMDIWGLREELFAIARRIASQGYYCVVPNLFYREGKVRYERRNAAGQTVSFETLPAALKEEMRRHVDFINRQTARADIAAILDFCRGEPVDNGPAGSVGFCLGGRFAFYAAQEFPQRFRANASLHGTRLVTGDPDSPHRLVDRTRGEFYGGYGEHDHFVSLEARAALEQNFAACTSVTYRTNVHPGADHGYALPDRDVYDHAAVETDWREIFAMYKRQLGRSD